MDAAYGDHVEHEEHGELQSAVDAAKRHLEDGALETRIKNYSARLESEEDEYIMALKQLTEAINRVAAALEAKDG